MNLNLALIEQALKDEMADQFKNEFWSGVGEIRAMVVNLMMTRVVLLIHFQRYGFHL